MTDEVQELQEHAEHAAHNPGLAPVTVTMAVFAVLVAAISLLGHRSDTEALLLQTRATDQWAYYQAKDIRRRSYELFLDEAAIFSLQTSNSDQIEKIKDKYAKQVAVYQKEQTDIEDEARKAEQEVTVQQRRADRFDLGEVMLEAGLVICSITLLTRNRIFWKIGIVLGVAALVLAAAGLSIH